MNKPDILISCTSDKSLKFRTGFNSKVTPHLKNTISFK